MGASRRQGLQLDVTTHGVTSGTTAAYRRHIQGGGSHRCVKSVTGGEGSMTGCGSTSGHGTSLEEGKDGCELQPNVDTQKGGLHMNGAPRGYGHL